MYMTTSSGVQSKPIRLFGGDIGLEYEGGSVDELKHLEKKLFKRLALSSSWSWWWHKPFSQKRISLQNESGW